MTCEHPELLPVESEGQQEAVAGEEKQLGGQLCNQSEVSNLVT